MYKFLLVKNKLKLLKIESTKHNWMVVSKISASSASFCAFFPKETKTIWNNF